MPYLDVDTFKVLTLMPAEDVDVCEGRYPGWLEAQLTFMSSQIDSRLRKRYAAPFAEPYPEVVKGWLARLVTVRCYIKVGTRPTDEQFVLIKEDAEAASEEITEAADAENSRTDLPAREDTAASGISKGGTFSYTEASPYVGFDVQADTGRVEDSNRRGTYG